ncbi:precorrin-2 C(20)-methyltransferase [Halovulum sp. GXIMD14793]
MSGVLYGVGLGPGDPELVTLKAARLIDAADVVAYPAPDTGDSFARSIAAGLIPEGVTEIPIVIPMRTDRYLAQDVYDQAAEAIAAHLEAGRDVVVLCEGDPFFYGSFMYLFARLSVAHRCEVVPGVTSLTGCAAAAARPICARNEALTVLPGPLPDHELVTALRRGGAFAIMKVGRHMPRLRALIAAEGLTARATYIAHASLAEQVVLPLDEAPEKAPYFSMILIAGSDPYAS